MFRCGLVVLLALPILLIAEDKPEPLVEQVRTAIERGIRYMRRVEAGKGHWESGELAVHRPGGQTTLAMLALANAGVPVTDPMMQRGLDYVRALNPKLTYVIGLQTMVLAEIGDARDLERIQANVDWLVKSRVIEGERFSGWGYTDDKGIADNSNSQYALLGLNAGRQAGAKIGRAVWESIRTFYRDTQSNKDREEGGWPYHPVRNGKITGGPTTLTMTVAGLCGLEVVAQELDQHQQGLQEDGTATNCGVYVEDEAIHKALDWLNQNGPDNKQRFRFADPHPFYNLYGIERAGRLTGRRFLAGRDWYREGCEYLVTGNGRQDTDDSWITKGDPSWFPPNVNTSFALLFLTKGRTPVLISKWAHGREEGWNNKHSDTKHLVDYVSQELFKKQPLAWQVYDARQLSFRSREERAQEVGNLLQSPILYMNGHTLGSMSDTQMQILKQYLEEGGFLMAEACCGRAEFTRDFRALMKRLFPDNQLRPLGPEHPIWRSHTIIKPEFAEWTKLEGINMGCKTVVVFSPKPLAGYWEENLTSEGRGREAFRLGANIVAYATGLEMPNVRLTPGSVSDDKADRVVPRGVFQVAQLRHEGDWQPAPRAMSNLMRSLREQHKLDVDLRTTDLEFTSLDLFKFKFLYLHGRGRFVPSDDGIDNLRAALKAGGTLLSDACCGSPAFDTAFREMAARLFPGSKVEPIAIDDPLYSAEINGEKIESIRVRANSGYDSQPPALEGIKVDGRWAVIYSPMDLGCALEKHASPECRGHDHESAMRLATAAALYSLKK